MMSFCALDMIIITRMCSRRRYMHSVMVLLHVCVCVLVVEECKRRLLAVGFKELREKESWNVNPLGKV